MKKKHKHNWKEYRAGIYWAAANYIPFDWMPLVKKVCEGCGEERKYL